ncbi:MAG: hypothetical protein AAF353_08510 [Pseudomonadota bacterium]
MIRAYLLLSLLTCGALSQSAYSSETPKFEVYTTNLQVNGQPDYGAITRFDCSDRIYLVLEAQYLPRKKHSLEVDWIGPDGENRERTRYEFNGYAFTRTWAWLQMNGPNGAAIGQIFDPSFGMDSFIGSWRANVKVNGKKVAAHAFDVLC